MIIVVISLIVILFPLYWLIANSLRTKTDYLANPPILFNAPVTFQNYQKILVENGIYKQFANTFVVAAVSTIIAVVFGSMAAYSTVRGRIAKKIRNFFGLWFMIQKMYPAIATAIPVYLVMRNLRLIDTRFALIIMNKKTFTQQALLYHQCNSYRTRRHHTQVAWRHGGHREITKTATER